MIEVEKKFILTPEQKKALTDGAEFLGEKIINDKYYDDENYSLTKKDIWLRNRNGKFEVKLPLNVSIEKRISDQYKEIEDEKEIKKYFKFDKNKSILGSLDYKGYKPFYIVSTTRKKYRKEGFNIDIDVTDFGYNVIEIEYMIEDNANLKETTDKIILFAKKHGIDTDTYVRGKAEEYLRRNNPKHYQKLVAEKVFK